MKINDEFRSGEKPILKTNNYREALAEQPELALKKLSGTSCRCR